MNISDNLNTKFNSIISICDNIENKHKSNNTSIVKIKEKLLSLGHGYIDITELISGIIDTNEELTTELNKLKKSLIEYNSLLLSKIDKLEINNKQLKSNIDQLTINVQELMLDNQKHKNMLIIRETVIMFDNLIIRNIFNTEKKDCKLSDIIYDKHKLNKEQLFNLEMFENESKCKSEDLLWYLSQLKIGGNESAHEKFKDPNLHTTAIKSKLIEYVREYYDEELYNEFDNIIELIITKIKDKYGEYPFKEKIKKPKN